MEFRCFECGYADDMQPDWDWFYCPFCGQEYSWEWESSTDGSTSGFIGYYRT